MTTQFLASASRARRLRPSLRRLGQPEAIALALFAAVLVAELALIALAARFVDLSGPIFTT